MRNFITNFLAIIVMLIFEQHHPVVSLSPIHQKTALFQFQQSLTISTSSFDVCYILQRRYFDASPSHPKTKNWSMSSDHCTWEGVSCDHETGDVIGLDLSCSRLEGSIHPNSTLFQLSHLHFLNLSNNDFSLSNQFPQEFSYFAKGLTHLNLSYTRFSGRVPSGISHLSKLVSLDLSYNFNTKLEDEVFKSVIQNLTQLRVLNLEGVNINSVLPVNLSTSLRVLNLMDTGLYGVLPLFHLPNLEVLDLSSVNSVLPMNLSTSLRVLNLGNTGLYGVLPQEVFHLPNLERLDLSDNTDLTVIFPKVKWGSSGSLQYLVLNEINFHQRGIPDSIGFLDSLATLDLLNCNFSGQIPKSIGNLGQLTSLGLDGNNLNGPIPKSMGNLSQLTFLGLGGNNLNGPIPKSMGNLSQLTFLDLYGNNLSGPIPKSMGKLGQLTVLSLNGNNFTDPFSLGCFDHLSLESLDISQNGFTGSLPLGLFDHPSLEYLDISYNGFTGQLYEFDSSKSKLQSFSCGNNLLYGPIPQSFSQLVNLTELDLSSNNFNGVLDFKMFSGLEHLVTLDLSHNSLSVINISMVTLPPKLTQLGLSSCKIKEFPNFSRDAVISLNWVDLSINEIEGEIPHWIGSMGQYLNISHNRLTGGLEQLPWNNIQYLDLQSNKFNGSLPIMICDSSSLEVLNLSNNTLSGVLPICRKNLTVLSVFDLRNNNFQGNIPSTLSNFRYLETINLNGNGLEGRIPSSFAEFDYLQVLDLGNNQINDTFPHCLEALPNLQVLVLKSNKFHGIISKSSKVEHPFPSLRIIDLSYNDFSGPLPTIYFKNFKSMMNGEVNKIKRSYMERQYYSDSTNLVIKGNEILLNKILTVYTTIDVSKNNFEGKIPVDIGYLVSLRFLNLSHNHLTGQIPTSIGKLIVLESLDLSTNQLEGEIPQQLTGLYSLALLNLSCNQLRGHIPEGSQFDTFGNDSYVGNLGLCGNPLAKKCGHYNVMQEEGEDEDNGYFFSGFTWEAVVIGYGCGVVPAFIIGYLMLLTRKPKWFVGIIARELGLKIRRMEIKWKY